MAVSNNETSSSALSLEFISTTSSAVFPSGISLSHFFFFFWNGCGIMYDRMEAETYLVSGAYSKFVLQA